MKAVIRPGMAVVLTLALAYTTPARANDMLSLATGRNDGPAYAAGVVLSSLIKFKLLPSKKIDMEVLESSGAVSSARLLTTGEAQLAILPSTVSHAARLGIGSFAGGAPATGLRGIATLWRDALHLVVREDDVATGTIDDLARLKEGKLFPGDAANGMVDANSLLLSDLGLSAGSAFELASISDGDAISAIKRGEVDAFSAAARPPAPMFEAVFNSASPGLRLLDVTERQMNKANSNHWLWTPYVIPAATYPGQNEDIWTIGLSNHLVVHADVGDDIVYAITRHVFENLDYLHRVDPVMADLSLDEALAGMGMPLHPGALRYYQEAGLIRGSEPETAPAAPDSAPADDDGQTAPSFNSNERYPDSDVADSGQNGIGGPLLDTETDAPSGDPASDSAPAAMGDDVPAPLWRQRATL